MAGQQETNVRVEGGDVLADLVDDVGQEDLVVGAQPGELEGSVGMDFEGMRRVPQQSPRA